VEDVLTWLASLPPAALYATLGIAAAVENIFPPMPTDTVVAFGSFLAARGEASPYVTFACTWLGNVLGAMAMYGVGRRYGASWFGERLKRYGGAEAEQRLQAAYAKRGLVALAVSRFVPGVRALVPPFAGAMHAPWPGVAAAIAIASGLWYGAITFIAYEAGEEFKPMLERLSGTMHWLEVAGIVLVLALVTWLVARRLRRA
jgi:membrane protein DedA with SNARE-associated domain